MSRDPLDVLLRLRRLDVNTAQRDLALRQRAAAEAGDARRAAQAAITHEAAIAAGQADGPAFAALFSRWLPHGLAVAEASCAVQQAAEQRADAARVALAAARAAAQATVLLQAGQARARRLAALRAEQSAADERAARARRPPGPGA
jgi:hypothetical protein